MSEGPLVVLGDALLDRDVEGVVERLAPDAPVPVLDERHVRARPGGAALAAALAAADGREVTLVTALARDAAGAELAALIAAAGVELVDLGLEGATPEKVRLRAAGRALLRIDRGGRPDSAHPVGHPSAAARAAIGWAPAILVADYGRGVAAEPSLRAALVERAADGVPIAWDPHPRGPTPILGVLLATPNERVAAGFAGEGEGEGLRATAARAALLRERWRARHVCITRGAAGALLDTDGGPPLVLPAPPVQGGDPCGAGDRFAARAAVLLAEGRRVEEAVFGAVEAASRFVAAGGAATFAAAGSGRGGAGQPAFQTGAAATFAAAGSGRGGAGQPAPTAGGADDADALIAVTRERGGTVVATGGCFDLLHAGHVRTLQAARALGDCLIVCLNGDASVRRLKGPSRPVVPAADRAALLAALACVDAVVVFEEDTPVAVLERLRPDVWAKGGDYAGQPMPEASAVERWGGRAVVLPHHEGLSTTRLLEEASTRAAS
jgi:rfaE bifunctional protein nucleotidyltransferase chain/domain/rfaE bifunctional protein kinase chain/domain